MVRAQNHFGPRRMKIETSWTRQTRGLKKTRTIVYATYVELHAQLIYLKLLLVKNVFNYDHISV